MRADGSLWRLPAVRQLAAVTVLGFSGLALTLASLPSWAVQGGATEAAAGWVTAVMLATTVAVQTAVPALVTRFGLGPVLALGLVALGAPTPAYLLDQHLPWLLVMSGVRGAGFAVLTVVGAVLAVRVAPSSRHGEAIGVYGLAIAVPNLVAVPAGTALTLAGHFDVVAWLAAAPVLALPLLPRLVRVSADPSPQAAPARGDRKAAVLAAIPPSTALLVVTLAGGGLLTFLPIARPSGLVAPVALLLFGATGALARWRAGVLADRLGVRVLLPVALVASIAGLGGVAAGLAPATGSDALILVSAGVFGAGFGATQNLTLVAAFARAGTSQVTTASAVWNGAFDAGTALGAVAVGTVAAGLGYPAAFVGCAIVVAAALPLTGSRGRGGTP